MNSSIFKAYDIRGIYPNEVSEDTFRLIGKAYVKKFNTKHVVVGADVRISSPSLKAALIEGLTQNGASVIDIGTISTDMLYFAVAHLKADGGITVSASHNPAEYNGLKMVLRDAYPISSDTGLFELRDMIEKGENIDIKTEPGDIGKYHILPAYLTHVRSFIDFSKLKPMKIIANGNFGMAGSVVRELMRNTPPQIILLNEKPDGTFPKGRPDPMRAENRIETSEMITKSESDFGVAWDADADRCFFYDEYGEFVEGYYITALLATLMLKKNGGGKVIFDPRLTWANIDAIEKAGGIPIVNKSGHTFIKERMRKEDAVFAGEVSGHYYFKENFYCDNGMIPFLLVLEKLSSTGKKLSELIAPFRKKYFVSGESNFTVKNPEAILEKIKTLYAPQAKIEEIDGISVEFPEWRFNVRSSNTEPLLRLNLESRTKDMLPEKFAEVKSLIEAA